MFWDYLGFFLRIRRGLFGFRKLTYTPRRREYYLSFCLLICMRLTERNLLGCCNFFVLFCLKKIEAGGYQVEREGWMRVPHEPVFRGGFGRAGCPCGLHLVFHLQTRMLLRAPRRRLWMELRAGHLLRYHRMVSELSSWEIQERLDHYYLLEGASLF